MPVREIVGKSLGFALVVAGCVAGGFFALYGPHASNDYLDFPLAVVLFLAAAGIAGLGTIIVTGIVVEARERMREERLHVTPRPGPLGPPPPWGMGDIGRPDRPGVQRFEAVATGARGRGGVRVVGVTLRHIDAPLLVGVLLLWTIGFCIWLAPR